MRTWVRYIVLALFIVLIFGGRPIYIYFYMLLFTVICAQVWVQVALIQLVVERKPMDQKFFVGENIPVLLELDNTGILPILWAYVEDNAPLGLLGVGRRKMFSLPKKRKQIVSYSFRANQRGVFNLNPLRITSSDILGLFHYSKLVDTSFEIMVYPRYKRLVFQEMGFSGPQSHIKATLSLKTDPLYIAGSRVYQRGDPLKQIDWKATARVSELRTRQIQYCKSLTTSILFNANLEDYGSDIMLEEGIEFAASFSKWVLDHKAQVAFFSNGRDLRHLDARGLPVLGVQAKESRGQFLRILDCLACIYTGRSYPFSKLLNRVSKEIIFGSSLVFITPIADDDLWRNIALVCRRGMGVWIIFTKRLTVSKRQEYFKRAQDLGINALSALKSREDETIEVRLL